MNENIQEIRLAVIDLSDLAGIVSPEDLAEVILKNLEKDFDAKVLLTQHAGGGCCHGYLDYDINETGIKEDEIISTLEKIYEQNKSKDFEDDLKEFAKIIHLV